MRHKETDETMAQKREFWQDWKREKACGGQKHAATERHVKKLVLSTSGERLTPGWSMMTTASWAHISSWKRTLSSIEMEWVTLAGRESRALELNHA